MANLSKLSKLRIWTALFFLGLIVSIYCYPIHENPPGRQSICAGNVRKLGLAFAQYIQDYDLKMPCGLVHRSGLGWASQIYPYVRDAKAYRCPDDKSHPADADLANGYSISYAYNPNAICKIDAFESPAQTVVVFEISGASTDMTTLSPKTDLSPIGNGLDDSLTNGSFLSFSDLKYATGYIGNRRRRSPTQFSSAGGLHSGGSNFLFADSHMKWFAPNSVSTGMNATNSTDPQTGTVSGRASGTELGRFSATFSVR